MSKMKFAFNAVYGILALAAVMLLFGCLNPFEPQLDRGKKAPEGKGYVTVSINKTDKRTIVPENTQDSFTQYRLVFYAVGTTTNPVKNECLDPRNIGDEIEMPVGTYDLYVTAYTYFISEEDDSQNKAVAKGSEMGLKVESDKPSGANVKLFAIEDGEGTFRWSISYPAGASATITIDPLDVGLGGEKIWTIADTPTEENEKGKADSVELRSGTYRVTFDLTDDAGRSLKRSDILHVYQNMESFFGKNGEGDFKEDYFIIKRVNNIALAVATVKTNESLKLVGVVSPLLATFRDIVWEVIDDPDDTGAVIDEDGVFSAKLAEKAGSPVTLRATIENGAGYLVDYVQETGLVITVTYVEVSGIEIDPKEIELDHGTTVIITAKATPPEATNKKLNWRPYDNSGIFEIVEVNDKDGTVKIKGLKPGTTKVEVLSESNTRLDSVECKVTVNPVPLTGITLSAEYVMLPVGGSTELKAIFAPPNATFQDLIWKGDSSASNIEVDDNGVVTIKNSSIDRGTITVTNEEGLITATCQVIIDDDIDAGYLQKVNLHTNVFTDGIKLQVGKKTQLLYTITPEDAEPYRLFWASGDFNVVSVVDDGKVRIGHGNPAPGDDEYDDVFEDAKGLPDGTITALKAGLVEIAVTTAKGGKIAVCRIEAYDPDPAKPSIEGIALPDDLHFVRNRPEYITPIFTPEDAGNKNLLWYSSDTDVASIGLTTGLVTAKVPGKTTISVITEDRGLTADCEIEVDFVAVKDVKIITNTLMMNKNQTITLRSAVYPENATYREVEWFIDEGDEDIIARVNKTTGAVTYLGGPTGTARTWLNVRSITQPDITARCRIQAREGSPLVTGIRLNIHKLRAATDPKTPPMPLVATITPANAEFNDPEQDLSWFSTDITVAEVEDGQVIGKSAGKVQIIVMAKDGGLTDMCEVEIYEGSMAVTDITLNTQDLILNGNQYTSESARTAQLIHNLQPFGTTGEVTWESDWGKVAVNNGLVSYSDKHPSLGVVFIGTATITAISVEGGFMKKCTVSVYATQAGYDENPIYPSTDSLDLEEGMSPLIMLRGSPPPVNVEDKRNVWYSTNPAVAEVDYETGVITTKTPGDTTIIVTRVIYGTMASIAVKVRAKGDRGPAVDGVRLNTTNLTGLGSAGTSLQAFVGPFISEQSATTAANPAVYWWSDSDSINVDQNGLISSRSSSKGTVVATTIDGGYTAMCTVDVKSSGTVVTGLQPIVWKYLTLNLRPNIVIGEYNYGTYKPTILPINATNQNFTYFLTNPDIATVDPTNGRITAQAVGRTTVIATTINGYSQSIEVIVVPAGPGGSQNATVQSVNRITMPPMLTLRPSPYTQKIPTTVEPVNALKELFWTSSNPDVATVDQTTGEITFVNFGKTDITATSVDGGKSNKCTVTMELPQVRITGYSGGNFYMSTYTITELEYRGLLKGDLGDTLLSSVDEAGEVQGLRPATGRTFFDALVFCNLLSLREGLTPVYEIQTTSGGTTWTTDTTRWGSYNDSANSNTNRNRWDAARIVSGTTGYRLPDENTWIYAYRAGTSTNWYWGNAWDNDYGWCAENSGGKTHEVGKKLPNAWGLYDMSGNVREWCWDKYYYPDYNQYHRRLKGGSRASASTSTTVISQDGASPYNNYSVGDVGFRVIRSAP